MQNQEVGVQESAPSDCVENSVEGGKHENTSDAVAEASPNPHGSADAPAIPVITKEIEDLTQTEPVAAEETSTEMEVKVEDKPVSIEEDSREISSEGGGSFCVVEEPTLEGPSPAPLPGYESDPGSELSEETLQGEEEVKTGNKGDDLSSEAEEDASKNDLKKEQAIESTTPPPSGDISTALKEPSMVSTTEEKGFVQQHQRPTQLKEALNNTDCSGPSNTRSTAAHPQSISVPPPALQAQSSLPSNTARGNTGFKSAPKVPPEMATWLGNNTLNYFLSLGLEEQLTGLAVHVAEIWTKSNGFDIMLQLAQQEDKYYGLVIERAILKDREVYLVETESHAQPLEVLRQMVEWSNSVKKLTCNTDSFTKKLCRTPDLTKKLKDLTKILALAWIHDERCQPFVIVERSSLREKFSDKIYSGRVIKERKTKDDPTTTLIEKTEHYKTVEQVLEELCRLAKLTTRRRTTLNTQRIRTRARK